MRNLVARILGHDRGVYNLIVYVVLGHGAVQAFVDQPHSQAGLILRSRTGNSAQLSMRWILRARQRCGEALVVRPGVSCLCIGSGSAMGQPD